MPAQTITRKSSLMFFKRFIAATLSLVWSLHSLVGTRLRKDQASKALIQSTGIRTRAASFPAIILCTILTDFLLEIESFLLTHTVKDTPGSLIRASATRRRLSQTSPEKALENVGLQLQLIAQSPKALQKSSRSCAP